MDKRIGGEDRESFITLKDICDAVWAVRLVLDVVIKFGQDCLVFDLTGRFIEKLPLGHDQDGLTSSKADPIKHVTRATRWMFGCNFWQET